MFSEKPFTFALVTQFQHISQGSRPRYAIIVAGGKGLRMGGSLPKQFLLLDRKPILYYSVRAFTTLYPDIHIILVHAPGDEPLIGEVTRYFPGQPFKLVAGGAARFESVKNGLGAVGEDSLVFIHDGVRPLVTADLILRCERVALEKGNAIPATELKETIRSIRGQTSVSEDRTRFRAMQTPQTFLSEVILKAFDQPYDPAFTDEASVVEKAGVPVQLVEGDYRNLKITRPEDLALAEILLDGAKGTP